MFDNSEMYLDLRPNAPLATFISLQLFMQANADILTTAYSRIEAFPFLVPVYTVLCIAGVHKIKEEANEMHVDNVASCCSAQANQLKKRNQILVSLHTVINDKG